jgi:hypothetical protein
VFGVAVGGAIATSSVGVLEVRNVIIVTPSIAPTRTSPPLINHGVRECRGERKSNREEGVVNNRVRTSAAWVRFSSSTFRKASRMVLIQ